MTALFVTATGTEIGKTFITAALIHELRRRGRAVDVLKPVVSGFDPAELPTSDPGILLDALGRKPTREALDQMSPWRFAAPLSPDMAASREGRRIDFDALLGFSRRSIDAAPDTSVIEGVGGLMVPLDERHTVLDWIAALRVPALLVCGSYLGTISHSLTALDVLARRHVAIKAAVINESPGSSVSLRETIEAIRRFAGGTEILGLPRLANKKSPHATLQYLVDLL